MRDKTASKIFRAKKKLDHSLEAFLPGIYLPLYTMVTFTRIPYAEAARRARRQDRILLAGVIVCAIAILAASVWLAHSLVGLKNFSCADATMTVHNKAAFTVEITDPFRSS